MEMKYWGLKPSVYGAAISKLDVCVNHLQKLLDQPPKIPAAKCLNKFKEIGALNLEGLRMSAKIVVDPSIQILQNVREGYLQTKDGQMDGEGRLRGAGRKSFDYLGFEEGQFLDDNLHAYGRSFEHNGSYYVGEWNEGKMHGAGKQVDGQGNVREGLFENNMFVDELFVNNI